MLFARVAAIALLSLVGRPPLRRGPAPVSAARIDAALIEDLVAANRSSPIRGCSMPMAMSASASDQSEPLSDLARDVARERDGHRHHGVGLDSNPSTSAAAACSSSRFIHANLQGASRRECSDPQPFAGRGPVRHHQCADTGQCPTPLFSLCRRSVFEIRDAGGTTENMLVRNAALAKRFAATLGDKPGRADARHAMSCRPNVKRATIRAVYTR